MKNIYKVVISRHVTGAIHEEYPFFIIAKDVKQVVDNQMFPIISINLVGELYDDLTEEDKLR